MASEKPEPLEPPHVEVVHLLRALKERGHTDVVRLAEGYADLATADDLRAAAQSLPIRGPGMRIDAKRYLNRALTKGVRRGQREK